MNISTNEESAMNISAYERSAAAFAACLREEERAESTITQYLREIRLFIAWMAEGGETAAGEACITGYCKAGETRITGYSTGRNRYSGGTIDGNAGRSARHP